MAISRREIIKLGVSYGTGAINFGNDSVVYERELRKLKDDTKLAEFLEELARVTEVLEAQEAEAEAAAETAEAETGAEAAAEDEATESKLAGQEPTGETADDAEATVPAEEATAEAPAEPAPNPLDSAIEKAFAFRAMCGRMALGELFVQTTALINTMRESCLPPVEDVQTLEHDYNAILNYLAHC